MAAKNWLIRNQQVTRSSRVAGFQAFPFNVLARVGCFRVFSREPLTMTTQFLDYGRYVRGWSPKTIRTYRQSLTVLPAELSRASLQALVGALRMRGLTPGGINVRLRSINSYLSWLHTEGHTAERLKVRPQSALVDPVPGWAALTEVDAPE
jgi:hypothetical protein